MKNTTFNSRPRRRPRFKRIGSSGLSINPSIIRHHRAWFSDAPLSRPVAFLTIERLSKVPTPPFFGHYPGATHKRRLMAYVLPMPAREIGDPVAVFVLMKPDDRRLHASTTSSARTTVRFLGARSAPGQPGVEARRIKFNIGGRPRVSKSLFGGRRLAFPILRPQGFGQTV